MSHLVESLIKCGANMDVLDGEGRTPLHYAALEGQIDIVRFLLKSGANPNLPDYKGWKPWMLAAIHGYNNMELIQVLNTHDEKMGDVITNHNILSPHVKSPHITFQEKFSLGLTTQITHNGSYQDQPASHSASSSSSSSSSQPNKGCTEKMSPHTSSSVSQHSGWPQGQSLLHLASRTDGAATFLASLLLYEDLDLDLQDENGVTPLMEAVWNQRIVQASLLIHLGKCNVHLMDNSGKTVMDLVLENRRRSTTILTHNFYLLLIKAGMDVNKLYGGTTLLMKSVSSVKTVQCLIRCGADPNIVTADGSTLFSRAVVHAVRTEYTPDTLVYLMESAVMDRHLCDLPNKVTGLTLMQSVLGGGYRGVDVARLLLKYQCPMNGMDVWLESEKAQIDVHSRAITKTLINEIREAVDNRPLRLSENCRFAVLRAICAKDNCELKEKVRRLGLPQIIQEYISWDGFWKSKMKQTETLDSNFCKTLQCFESHKTWK